MHHEPETSTKVNTLSHALESYPQAGAQEVSIKFPLHFPLRELRQTLRAAARETSRI
eukprot:c22975_g1_i1 orf=843-1013(+)